MKRESKEEKKKKKEMGKTWKSKSLEKEMKRKING